MGARGPRTSADSRQRRPVSSLMRALEHVLILASVVLVLSLVYLLFFLLSGGMAAPLIGGSELETIERNSNLATEVFLICLWVVVLAAMVRHPRMESTGLLAFGLGAAGWGLMPLVVSAGVDPYTAENLQALGRSMASAFQTSGGALMVLGFLRVVLGRVIVLSRGPSTTSAIRLSRAASALAELPEEPVSERASIMRNCWELHFCRGSLRAMCPRYLERRSCWKERSGCYCDQGLASRLLSGVGAKARVQVAEELAAPQKRTSPRPGAAARARQTSARNRPKPPCGECPIYLEHQKHKYRAISLLAYPAGAVIMGLSVQYVYFGYRWLRDNLGASLGISIDRTGQGHVFDTMQGLSFENAMVVLLGGMVVAIILQLTELAIFRFKL